MLSIISCKQGTHEDFILVSFVGTNGFAHARSTVLLFWQQANYNTKKDYIIWHNNSVFPNNSVRWNLCYQRALTWAMPHFMNSEGNIIDDLRYFWLNWLMSLSMLDWLMAHNANISVISWRSVLLVEKIGEKQQICRKSLTNIMLYWVHLVQLQYNHAGPH